ncbi:MAG: CheR family methyltransferase [Methyloceanibacter sp.]
MPEAVCESCPKLSSVKASIISAASSAWRQQYREDVSFLLQDLRSEAPEGLFDLILCRNVAFTYFEAALQGEVLDRLVERLAQSGYLVIGAQEKLPREMSCLIPLPGVPGIFRYETALPRA